MKRINLFISVSIFLLIGCQEKIDQSIEISDWPFVKNIIIMEGHNVEFNIKDPDSIYPPLRIKNVDGNEIQITYNDETITNYYKDNSKSEGWFYPLEITLKKYPNKIIDDQPNINEEKTFNDKWNFGQTISVFKNDKHPNKFHVVYHRSFISGFSFNEYNDKNMVFLFEGFEALKAIQSDDLTTFESGVESLMHSQSSYIFSIEEQRIELDRVISNSKNEQIKKLAKKKLNELKKI